MRLNERAGEYVKPGIPQASRMPFTSTSFQIVLQERSVPCPGKRSDVLRQRDLTGKSALHSFGLGDDGLHQLGDGRQIVDQPHRLPRGGHPLVQVTGGHGQAMHLQHFGHAHHGLDLARPQRQGVFDQFEPRRIQLFSDGERVQEYLENDA